MKHSASGVLILSTALLAGIAGCTAGKPVDSPPPEMAVTAAQPELKVEAPSELAPMTIGAILTPQSAAPGETVSVMLGVRLLPGWHTYAYVPPEEPYIQTKFSLEPGSGFAATGEWLMPPPVNDAQNPQLKLYESTPEPLMFMHSLRVADGASGEAKVRVSVLFQVCDAFRCLPPATQTFDLKFNVR